MMDGEQKELLLQIAQWHIKDFNNRMVDTWNDKNYIIDSECNNAIRRLEKEYADKYGKLPEWKYIDDVWNTIKDLNKKLTEIQLVGGSQDNNGG